jgi:hypothetical protein
MTPGFPTLNRIELRTPRKRPYFSFTSDFELRGKGFATSKGRDG